jgi:hypothetical protein
MNLFIIQRHHAAMIVAQHHQTGQMENLLHQRSNRWKPHLTPAPASKTKTPISELIVWSSIQLTPSFPARLTIKLRVILSQLQIQLVVKQLMEKSPSAT